MFQVEALSLFNLAPYFPADPEFSSIPPNFTFYYPQFRYQSILPPDSNFNYRVPRLRILFIAGLKLGSNRWHCGQLEESKLL